MPRVYIEIAEPPWREAMRRALAERRSTREQIAFDVERLYSTPTAVDDANNLEPEPAEPVR